MSEYTALKSEINSWTLETDDKVKMILPYKIFYIN